METLTPAIKIMQPSDKSEQLSAWRLLISVSVTDLGGNPLETFEREHRVLAYSPAGATVQVMKKFGQVQNAKIGEASRRPVIVSKIEIKSVEWLTNVEERQE